MSEPFYNAADCRTHVFWRLYEWATPARPGVRPAGEADHG